MQPAAAVQVSGRDLRIGDVVGMLGGRDIITGLRPYTGLPDVFTGGASIATFARAGSMTIDHENDYRVHASVGAASVTGVA